MSFSLIVVLPALLEICLNSLDYGFRCYRSTERGVHSLTMTQTSGGVGYNTDMLFSDLALEFQEIEKTTLRNEMMVRIADLIKRADMNEVIPLVHLAMGQLRPKFDRLEFSLADKMVIRAIARSSSASTEHILQEYKARGDLGEVAFHSATTAAHKPSDTNMSIIEVYHLLEKIAQENGMGSQERKIDTLARLLSGLNPLSSKYVIRMVLGKLRLGFSDKTILDALSYMESGTKEGREDLDAAYQVAPDVAELARIVREMGAAKAKQAVEIVLGRPMMPQLAQRLRTADEMIEKMGTVTVEPKYDGTRVQIHYSANRHISDPADQKSQNGLFTDDEAVPIWVKTFTRNLDENTEMFPELQKIPVQIQAHEVILDSEAVGFDPETGKMVPFQMTITRKRKHGVDATAMAVPLKFFVFDILYKDGKSLLDLPLSERRALLRKTVVAVDTNDVLMVDDSITTDDPAVLRAYHAEQLAQGLEGALVKKAEGKYLPGRQDWNWVKFKEEEGHSGKLSDTIDAAVLGYYTGKGKRQSFGLGAFLVGIRTAEDTYVTIAKIGTGLSDEQFRELYTRLQSYIVQTPDSRVAVTKTLVPDVWVKPEVVVEIAADEVTRSPAHSSGYALRFPRLVRFRDDKGPDGMTTVAELKEIAGV